MRPAPRNRLIDADYTRAGEWTVRIPKKHSFMKPSSLPRCPNDIRGEDMHRTSKYAALVALALGLMVLAGIPVLERRAFRPPKARFDVQEATNTCACEMDSPGVVVLHIYSAGGLAINSESISKEQLAGRLTLIYGTRAERILYLFPENDTSVQRIAEIMGVVKRLRSAEPNEIPAPRELRTTPEDLNIQMRLVTSQALSAPCPKDCYNWGTQGFPVWPMASSQEFARPIQPLVPD
jgi:hypothetical protein